MCAHTCLHFSLWMMVAVWKLRHVWGIGPTSTPLNGLLVPLSTRKGRLSAPNRQLEVEGLECLAVLLNLAWQARDFGGMDSRRRA